MQRLPVLPAGEFHLFNALEWFLFCYKKGLLLHSKYVCLKYYKVIYDKTDINNSKILITKEPLTQKQTDKYLY